MNETNSIDIIIYYLTFINLLAFFVYGLDKLKAKRGSWRISEATLLLLAAIGGSVGAWYGMKVWHHKTLHRKFRYGVPLLFLIQVILCIFIASK
ncbi:MAG: DUF1294 domain-containing protein [Bacteroidaceae bacterium]|nr:DUF1294 domain-containing protein [Bacteroidaceae bacterium]